MVYDQDQSNKIQFAQALSIGIYISYNFTN
jgi:hypothetical protein